jgi:hypothetical protein
MTLLNNMLDGHHVLVWTTKLNETRALLAGIVSVCATRMPDES